MNSNQQISIFKIAIKNMDDLNELLNLGNVQINVDRFAHFLNNYNCNFLTDDLDEYLASLFAHVFLQKEEKVTVPEYNDEKIIIINFVNTVLEELNHKSIVFEVM